MSRVILLLLGLLAAFISSVNAQNTTQTYTWLPAALTFDYPADWVVRDDITLYGAVSIGSSLDALDASPIPAGEISVQIVAPLSLHPESIVRYGLAELTVFDALNLLQIPDAGGAQSRDINGQPGAYRSAQVNDLTFLLIALEQGNAIILLYAVSAPDDMLTFEDDIFALADSIRPAQMPTASGEVIAYDENPTPGTDDADDVGALAWRFVGDFETYALDGQPGSFGRLAVGEDRIMVATGGSALLMFGLDGTLQQIMRHPVIRFYDVAIDTDGTLWVLDALNTKIWHINTAGDVLNWFGQYGGGVDQFASVGPMDILVDADYVYVLSTNLANRRAIEDIQVWRKDGAFVGVLASVARNGGLRDSSLLVAGIDDDTLFFTFGGDVLASVYNKEGRLQRRINAFLETSYPGALAVEGDVLYFEHMGGIYRYDTAQGSVNIFGFPAENRTGELAAGSFFYPRGLAVLPSGDLIIADANETHWQIIRVAAGAD